MGHELSVALVQANLAWEAPSRNREYFNQLLTELPEATDLVVLPEMFSTGFTMEPHNLTQEQASMSLRWMQETAYENQFAILGSLVWPEGTKYYNRLFFVYPNGTYETYDKRHTFTLAGEDKVYTAGNSRLLIDYKDFRICPMICYDLRFPVWSRNTENYDVLIYVANWPEPRIQAWDSLLKARAIENMCYCIGVNRVGSDANGLTYVGHTAVYDPLGDQLGFSKQEEVLLLSLQKDHLKSIREDLAFLDDRDEFTLVD